MKTTEIIINEGPIKDFARGAAGAVKAGLKGQNMKAGAEQGRASGEANDQINDLTNDVYTRWNKKAAANPNNNNDKTLHQFILQYRKHAPETDFPAPTPGTSQNTGKTKQYIRDLVAAELSANEFGAKSDQRPDQPAQDNTAAVEKEKLTPGEQGTKQVTTQDPTQLPVGTQFTIGVSGGGDETYKWAGQQWLKLAQDGKWQAGQIKNANAWTLYLAAIKAGTALAPVSAQPDPKLAQPANPGAEPANTTPSQEFTQVSSWISKQDKTTANAVLALLKV